MDDDVIPLSSTPLLQPVQNDLRGKFGTGQSLRYRPRGAKGSVFPPHWRNANPRQRTGPTNPRRLSPQPPFSPLGRPPSGRGRARAQLPLSLWSRAAPRSRQAARAGRLWSAAAAVRVRCAGAAGVVARRPRCCLRHLRGLPGVWGGGGGPGRASAPRHSAGRGAVRAAWWRAGPGRGCEERRCLLREERPRGGVASARRERQRDWGAAALPSSCGRGFGRDGWSGAGGRQ